MHTRVRIVSAARKIVGRMQDVGHMQIACGKHLLYLLILFLVCYGTKLGILLLYILYPYALISSWYVHVYLILVNCELLGLSIT